MKRMAEYVRMRVDSCGYVKGRNEKSRPIQGRPFPKLRLRLLGIRLPFAGLAQQGSDEVDYFFVGKDETQGTECQFQYCFHSGITFYKFGGEGKQRRVRRCRYVVLRANACGSCVAACGFCMVLQRIR